ncbi:hypothetical protein BDR03DRAFT_1014177 [Suillus americanus]|nr:hypothetical protein BDR03DRAFT_1014177 [Suillus americanus]
MSTPVDNSLTALKASTGQIMSIISAAQQIPQGPSHMALGKQVATLVPRHMGPGMVLKAVFADPEAKAEGSKKRKSPLILGLPSEPPKSVMKSHKHQRSGRVVKSKPIVELGDEEDMIIKPFSRGVPEVILPQHSTMIARTPNSPQSPRALTKKPFGPATLLSPPSQLPDCRLSTFIYLKTTHAMLATSKTGLAQLGWTRGLGLRVCRASTARQRSAPPQLWDPRLLMFMPPLPPRRRGPGHHPGLPPRLPLCPKPPPPPKLLLPPNPSPELATQTCGCSKTITAVKAPAPAPLLSSSLAVPPAAPGPAVPAAAPSPAVPAAAHCIPMPDLHAMSIVIRDGAAQIALLKACVAEQDGKIDTLQHLHEGLRCEIIDRHPSFPLPNSPVNATSLLLDQSGPPTMSAAKSALPPLIDLKMEAMAPTTAILTFLDASAIKGLLFDLNQVVHPEDPDAPSEIVDPGDLSNLVPEYDSSNNMSVEVEVKVEESSEDVDMAT